MGFDTLELTSFVNQPVDKNLICNICFSVQETPTTICENGHTMCLHCVACWEAGGHNDCPECRQRLLHTKVLNRPLQSIIMALKLKCPNSRENSGTTGHDVHASQDTEARCKTCHSSNKRARCGDDVACRWEGTLADYLGKHQRGQCDFDPVECVHCGLMVLKLDMEEHHRMTCLLPCKQCGVKVRASELERHKKNQCRLRKLRCNLCQIMVKANLLDSHLERSCPNVEVACLYCHQTMPRKDLGKAVYDDQHMHHYACTGHLALCSQMEVYCEYRSLGCTAPTMKRQDLAEHHSQALQTHLTLLAPTLRALQDGTNWVRKSIQWDVSSEKLAKVCDGGVESHPITVCGVNLVFRLQAGMDESIEVKICTHCTGESESSPILLDFFQVDSIWGNHVCRLEGDSYTKMTLDSDHRSMWSVTGTLRIDSCDDEHGIAMSPRCACVFDDLINGTNQEGVYSLEVQFRVRNAPSKEVLSCA
jgi:TRAF-type zinc finger